MPRYKYCKLILFNTVNYIKQRIFNLKISQVIHNKVIKKLVAYGFLIVLVNVLSQFITNGTSVTYAEDLKQKKITTEDDWEINGGIQVLSIRRTAADSMLDFRYKVVDPKKAAIFIDKKNKPLLKILKNGVFLKVPVTAKIGPLRQSANFAKAGKNYFMFFGNPRRMVKTGDKVQVHIGDFKSKILIVE